MNDVVQATGWVALLAGNLGVFLLPRTRHGWLLAMISGVIWAVVDIEIALWSGLAGALLSLLVNGRAWARNVAGSHSEDEPAMPISGA